MKNNQTKFKETELGRIPEDWRVLKLKEISDVITKGTTPSTIGGGFSNVGVNFVKVESISDDGHIMINKLAHIDSESDNLLKRSRIKSGDLLFTIAGTIGRIARVDNSLLPMNTNQAVAIIRLKKSINTNYVYYWLKSPRVLEYRLAKTIQCAQANLNLADIGNIDIIFPEADEQQKIAEVLGALDEKIELNRKMNKTLESLAQAIFKKWFIDDADPNWETKKLGDVVRIKYGKNLPTTKLQESGYPVFGGNGQIGFFDKYLYEFPQVLVACRGAASGKVNFSLPKSFVTNNSLVFEYDNSLNYEFLKYFALNADFYSCVSGSAQPQITIESLDGYEIMMPDKEILNKFGQVVGPLTKKILINDNEIKTLSQIRDSLLPRLMSGKLRVK